MPSPSAVDARRWLARFAAVDAVRREESARPVETSTSIRLALSLIAVAFDRTHPALQDDPVRRRDEQAVRDVWARLRRAKGVGQ